jgi:K319L-like, PKD domain
MDDHRRRLFGSSGSRFVALVAAAALAACSGGGNDDSGGTGNRNPTANAGADQTVAELTAVGLNGSGSDPDAGDSLSYAWTQTLGPAVTINNADMAVADFIAPDVAAGAPEALEFQLVVTDQAGANDQDRVTITVQEPQPVVTISGKVQYEFVPPNANCNGLNYLATETRPIRGATVQIVDATSGTVIDTMPSSDAGDYSFTVDANTMVLLRVRAELLRAGANPSWNVQVRDNTADTGLPLSQRPLYVLDGAAFDSGNLDSNRNLTATTGWGVVSYTGVRAAAPFSVLDTIYSVMSTILAEAPQADFPALDAFWSVNNTSVQGAGTFDDNAANGEIGTSFYSAERLFLLGMADEDTEEFDDHVVVHEWGHYFEDNFSRSDNIGGAHSLGQSLDMRVAFGEGWATALSGIGLDDPQYCDTSGAAQGGGFGINIETTRAGTDGWFNEVSVLNLIYDLWDTDSDGMDTDSVGFGPIYRVMTGAQAGTAAFTSIYSFAAALENEVPVAAAFIDTLLDDHNIARAGGVDIYGSTETNDRGGAADVLPLYTSIVPDGVSTVNICSNDQFDGNYEGNKLSTHRYLRMTVSNPSALTFSVITTTPMPNPDDPADDSDQSDPDLLYYRDGQIQNRIVGGLPQGLSGDANREIFTTPNIVAAGDYVIDLHEFRYEDDQSPANYPSRTCFDVTIGP